MKGGGAKIVTLDESIVNFDYLIYSISKANIQGFRMGDLEKSSTIEMKCLKD